MTTLDLPDENSSNKQKLLKIDLYVQLAIIIVSAILAIGDVVTGLGGIYFVLGGYQLISSIIHLFFKPISGLRKAYYPQLIIHLVALSVGIFLDSIGVLYIELFATPITALYYLVITVVEFYKIKK